jgi:hypothetical protein
LLQTMNALPTRPPSKAYASSPSGGLFQQAKETPRATVAPLLANRFGRETEIYWAGGTIANPKGYRANLDRAQPQPGQRVFYPLLDSGNHTRQTLGVLMATLLKEWRDDVLQWSKKPNLPLYIEARSIPNSFRWMMPFGHGQVVAHGTDTLIEAACLKAFYPNNKVTVFTGSWTTPGAPDSDAKINLDNAHRVASDPYTPPGTYVVVGSQIHLPTQLHAIDTKPKQGAATLARRGGLEEQPYFGSLNDKSVGYLTHDTIYWNSAYLWEQEKRLTSPFYRAKPLLFDATAIKPAYVEQLLIDQATPVEQIEAAFKRLQQKRQAEPDKPVGLILDGRMKGHPFEPVFNQQIKALKEQRIYVVESDYSHNLLPQGQYIPAQQLRIKLSALLSLPAWEKKLETLLWKDLAGELVPQSGKQAQRLTLPEHFHERAELVQAYPGMLSTLITEATQRLVALKPSLPATQKPLLLINGYGDGQLPIGTQSIESRLKQGFHELGHQEKTSRHLRQLLKSLDASPNQDNAGQAPGISLEVLVGACKQVLAHEKRDSAEAQPLLRSVIRKTDPMLNAIAEAVDAGIEVRMGSQAIFSTPTLKACESGSLLRLMGVQPTNRPTQFYINEQFAT